MAKWKIRVGLRECKTFYEQMEEEQMLPFLPRKGDVFWMSEDCQDRLEKRVLKCMKQHCDWRTRASCATTSRCAAWQPQSPVFVSAYDIAHYDGPETEPDNAGLMTITALHGETPKGYRCPDIEAFYMWEPNGPGKGFTQSLICRFHGSEPHFNHMLRFMCRRKAEYVILLPRPKKPFLFVGGSMTDIGIERRRVEHQTFVMKYGCCIEPLPYYDGPLDIDDCTEPELMKKIY